MQRKPTIWGVTRHIELSPLGTEGMALNLTFGFRRMNGESLLYKVEACFERWNSFIKAPEDGISAGYGGGLGSITQLPVQTTA